MAKILLVDDDQFFRVALREILLKNHHDVMEANNGRNAKDILSLSSFDLIISDIRMPHFSGIELLEWIKTTRPHPVILITGFSQIFETKKADEMGADGFLIKPFHEVDILDAIHSCLGNKTTSDKEPVIPKTQFCKISLNDFVVASNILFSIFIKLRENKFVKIAHNGENIPLKKIDYYRAKGISHLYLKSSDFSSLIDFNLEVLNKLSTNSQIGQEKKNGFIKYTNDLILEKAFVSGLDRELYDQASFFVQTSLEHLVNNNSVIEILDILKGPSPPLYSHSLGVSVFSIMIARQLGWTSSNTFIRLGVAGLFHDIGKKEIDRNIFKKNRYELTIKERKLVETHPSRGRDIMLSIKSIPEEVSQIIYEHHENCIGEGFPNGIKANKIHPLSKLVIVANIFCEYIIENAGSKPISSAAALRKMEINKVHLDKDSFIALSKLVTNNMRSPRCGTSS